jgi:hypothetical protein
MKNTIYKILDKIVNENILSEEKTIIKSKHIFDSLILNFKDDLEKQSLLNLYYYMDVSEKTLNHYRNRELNQANHYIDTLKSLENAFVEPVQYGMLNLYYALLSYKSYVLLDYKLALKQIDKAINYAVEQSKTFPYFVSVISEQWLNKIRIFIKIKDYDNTLIEVVKLNRFLIYNEHANILVKENFKMIPINDKLQMINHIIYSIDFAFNNSFENHNEFYYKISTEIISKSYNSTTISDIENTYQTIDYIKKDSKKFLEKFSLNFDSIKKAPLVLQRIIIISFIEICKGQQFDIKQHPNNVNFDKTLNYLNINIA